MNERDNDDYSLATLLRRATARNEGKPLSDKQKEEWRDLAKRHRDALKKIDDLKAERAAQDAQRAGQGDTMDPKEFSKMFAQAVKDYTAVGRARITETAKIQLRTKADAADAELRAMGFPTAESSKEYTAEWYRKHEQRESGEP